MQAHKRKMAGLNDAGRSRKKGDYVRQRILLLVLLSNFSIPRMLLNLLVLAKCVFVVLIGMYMVIKGHFGIYG